MQYYSTSRKTPSVNLQDAIFTGLASDGGLYMPENVRQLPNAFYHNIKDMTLNEIAFVVMNALFGEEIDSNRLKHIVDQALNFDIPLKRVDSNIYVLELFHGPTFAFKDVGARLMARIISHLNQKSNENINVLVATSGDSGGAVANGFYDVPGVNVFVLYPKGKISKEQEAQFAGLGKNIHAVEVAGSFDDCQNIVRQVFSDRKLTTEHKLTSANSFNPVRLLPQIIYYFHAYASLMRSHNLKESQIVFSVPSGNLGNLCSGLFAKRMGLPVKRFIAANNANNVFQQYLQTGIYQPRKAIYTKASAMDVGRPSNFTRIVDLYNNSHSDIKLEIAGFSYSDKEITDAIADTHRYNGYVLDPHGATAYLALKESLLPSETGIFLETAHPAKFRDTVENAIDDYIPVPIGLQCPAKNHHKHSIAPTYTAFRKYLLNSIKH